MTDREISGSTRTGIDYGRGCVLLLILITPYFIIFANFLFPLLPSLALGGSSPTVHDTSRPRC